jgi:phosphoglycolate phosphatase
MVVFDLDGTLIDSREDIADALNAALADAGLPERSLLEVERMIGGGVSVLVARALGSEHVLHAPRVVAAFREHYARWQTRKTRPYPGVPALLAQLGQAGIQCAVLTNKPEDFARAILDHLGLATWFVEIAGEAPGTARKPDPGLLRAVLEQARAMPAASAYVGDGAIDVATARNAGVRSIAVSWGYGSREELARAAPDRLVDSVAALADLLLAGGDGPGEA